MGFSDFVQSVRRNLGLVGDTSIPTKNRLSATGTIESNPRYADWQAQQAKLQLEQSQRRAEAAPTIEAFDRMNADPMNAYANADQSVIDASQVGRDEYADRLLAKERKQEFLDRMESSRLAMYRPEADRAMMEYFAAGKDPAVLMRPENRDALERLSGSSWAFPDAPQDAQKKTAKPTKPTKPKQPSQIIP